MPYSRRRLRLEKNDNCIEREGLGFGVKVRKPEPLPKSLSFVLPKDYTSQEPARMGVVEPEERFDFGPIGRGGSRIVVNQELQPFRLVHSQQPGQRADPAGSHAPKIEDLVCWVPGILLLSCDDFGYGREPGSVPHEHKLADRLAGEKAAERRSLTPAHKPVKGHVACFCMPSTHLGRLQ
ncbi:hypothetical protein LX36DRAFT_192696 [Colletotrichum falcatum]|nr:hypothetical protein LX36DRAFT_192696 [Colletotrichum falcatum]